MVREKVGIINYQRVTSGFTAPFPYTTVPYPIPARTYGTLPVKLMPQRCSELVIMSPNVGPSAGTNWIMLGGKPASRRMR